MNSNEDIPGIEEIMPDNTDNPIAVSSAWDQEMESFFNKIIPEVSGDAPFLCLDLLEALDRAESGSMNLERISTVIKKPRASVEKTLRFLLGLKIINKNTDQSYLLCRENLTLKRFIYIYRTPSGRLKIVEKILGF